MSLLLSTGSGGASLTATLSVTLDDVGFSVNATVGHGATINVTLDDVTLAANAALGHNATLSIALDDLVFAANAVIGHTCALNITLDDIYFNGLSDITPAAIGGRKGASDDISPRGAWMLYPRHKVEYRKKRPDITEINEIIAERLAAIEIKPETISAREKEELLLNDDEEAILTILFAITKH